VYLSAVLHTCGNTAEHFYRYWDLESKAKKIKLLEVLGCNQPSNYAPRSADPIITRVLADALNNDVPSKTIKMVLTNYHCAYGGRNLTEYQTIKNFITEQKYAEFCDIERLQRIYIVKSKGGAVFRSAPSVSSERLDAIAEGAFVEVEDSVGEWAKIKYAGVYGYVFKPLLSAY